MNEFSMPDIRETDQLFDRADIVKAGAVREVRTCGKIFIKLDKRRNRSFKTEFDRAVQLQKYQIPVTRPLFHTDTARGSYLVTEAFDGVSLEEYLKKNHPGKEFFFAAAELLKKMLANGFLHTDFHTGNLLYSEKNGTFALVDVDGIKKIPAFLMPLMPGYIRFHLLTEFRSHLEKKDLLELFRFAGVNSPEKFYRSIFIRNRKYIRHTWDRRRKQILDGYPKFTFLRDGVLTDTNNDGKPADPDILGNGKAVFLAHFYLKLIRMPHRELLTFDPQKNCAAAVAEDHTVPDDEIIQEMIERINWYGIDSTPADWRQGKNGLPVFYPLEKVAALPFICGEEK